MTARNFARALAGLAAMLLVAILLLGVVWVRVNHAQTRACMQIESLKTVVRRQIVQSEHLIGRPGSPGYAYYKEHPAELRAARQEAQRELSEFAPGRC